MTIRALIYDDEKQRNKTVSKTLDKEIPLHHKSFYCQMITTDKWL